MIRFEQFSTDAASQESLVRIRSLCDAAFDGRFSDIDLTAPLTCEERTGDEW